VKNNEFKMAAYSEGMAWIRFTDFTK